MGGIGSGRWAKGSKVLEHDKPKRRLYGFKLELWENPKYIDGNYSGRSSIELSVASLSVDEVTRALIGVAITLKDNDLTPTTQDKQAKRKGADS